MKESSDQIGEQFDATTAKYNFTRTSKANVLESQLSNGFGTTQIFNSSQGRTGSENTGNRSVVGNAEKLIY